MTEAGNDGDSEGEAAGSVLPTFCVNIQHLPPPPRKSGFFRGGGLAWRKILTEQSEKPMGPTCKVGIMTLRQRRKRADVYAEWPESEYWAAAVCSLDPHTVMDPRMDPQDGPG